MPFPYTERCIILCFKGDDGVFRAIIDRPAGTKILFKFVVDGEWKNASNYEEETDDSVCILFFDSSAF